MTLGPWLAQVHAYPVGGYMEQLVRLRSCGHTPSWSSVLDPRVALSLWLTQVVHIYPVARGSLVPRPRFPTAAIGLHLRAGQDAMVSSQVQYHVKSSDLKKKTSRRTFISTLMSLMSWVVHVVMFALSLVCVMIVSVIVSPSA